MPVRVLLIPVALGCALLLLRPASGSGQTSAPDPLEALGYRVTAGAAPGYVDDAVCAMCHNRISRSYQEVGMARAFYRPDPGEVIEDFENNHFYHEASRRHYEMAWREGRLIFKRYQEDPSGQPINVVEQEVHWILGSGHRSRTYLYQTPQGELYQLPTAWYSQPGRWDMAPGFEGADHLGLRRLVRRPCMFCHNSYPEVPARSDVGWAPHVYPRELPAGTGCQRCHGPGAQHARMGLQRKNDVEALRTSIVNPARLEPRLRDDVCDACHLAPAVAVHGVRRFGQGDYSFRPGEPLSNYLVNIEVTDSERPQPERFEINHHPYRLRQSRCFKVAGRKLNCLTCHDPHRKVPAAERAAHYRSACLTCHQAHDEHKPLEEPPGVDRGDCVGCHMPARRTQDVVNVVMTDHLIRRRPGGPELVAPLEKQAPVLVDVELYDPASGPTGALAEVYRAVAVIHAAGPASASAVEHLARNLPRVNIANPRPHLDLASAQMASRRFPAAERTLRHVLDADPDDALALEWMGMIRGSQRRFDTALKLLHRATQLNPDRLEASYNLALALRAAGRPAEATERLRAVVAARPTFLEAWRLLGAVHTAADRPAEAAAAYRRALEIEPGDGNIYVALGRTLVELGRTDEALRYWRHGLNVVAQPQAIQEEIAALQRGDASDQGGR